MRRQGKPGRIAITFAGPSDRCRRVILVLVVTTMAVAAAMAVTDHSLL
jgi:hypothetical protein